MVTCDLVRGIKPVYAPINLMVLMASDAGDLPACPAYLPATTLRVCAVYAAADRPALGCVLRWRGLALR